TDIFLLLKYPLLRKAVLWAEGLLHPLRRQIKPDMAYADRAVFMHFEQNADHTEPALVGEMLGPGGEPSRRSAMFLPTPRSAPTGKASTDKIAVRTPKGLKQMMVDRLTGFGWIGLEASMRFFESGRLSSLWTAPQPAPVVQWLLKSASGSAPAKIDWVKDPELAAQLTAYTTSGVPVQTYRHPDLFDAVLRMMGDDTLRILSANGNRIPIEIMDHHNPNQYEFRAGVEMRWFSLQYRWDEETKTMILGHGGLKVRDASFTGGQLKAKSIFDKNILLRYIDAAKSGELLGFVPDRIVCREVFSPQIPLFRSVGFTVTEKPGHAAGHASAELQLRPSAARMADHPDVDDDFMWDEETAHDLLRREVGEEALPLTAWLFGDDVKTEEIVDQRTDDMGPFNDFNRRAVRYTKRVRVTVRQKDGSPLTREAYIKYYGDAYGVRLDPTHDHGSVLRDQLDLENKLTQLAHRAGLAPASARIGTVLAVLASANPDLGERIDQVGQITDPEALSREWTLTVQSIARSLAELHSITRRLPGPRGAEQYLIHGDLVHRSDPIDGADDEISHHFQLEHIRPGSRTEFIDLGMARFAGDGDRLKEAGDMADGMVVLTGDEQMKEVFWAEYQAHFKPAAAAPSAARMAAQKWIHVDWSDATVRAIRRAKHPSLPTFRKDPAGGYKIRRVEGPRMIHWLGSEEARGLSDDEYLRKTVTWILKALEAVIALHQKGIAHADLALRNIVLEPSDSGERNPVLIDFDDAGMGSDQFMAPLLLGEVLFERERLQRSGLIDFAEMIRAVDQRFSKHAELLQLSGPDVSYPTIVHFYVPLAFYAYKTWGIQPALFDPADAPDEAGSRLADTIQKLSREESTRRIRNVLKWSAVLIAAAAAAEMMISQTTGFSTARWIIDLQREPGWRSAAGSAVITLMFGLWARINGMYLSDSLTRMSPRVLVWMFAAQLLWRPLLGITQDLTNWYIADHVQAAYLKPLISAAAGMSMSLVFDILEPMGIARIDAARRLRSGDPDEIAKAAQQLDDTRLGRQAVRVSDGIFSRVVWTFLQHAAAQLGAEQAYRSLVIQTGGLGINTFRSWAAYVRDSRPSARGALVSGIVLSAVIFMFFPPSAGIAALGLTAVSAG
ncbi:MAG: hypothetical protein KBD07_05930, partial [Candidatus Omnitrophica bacterium]|nr:hypothetical protein [Candidatus Omnitrophota bacterium]